ncbi:MAG: AMP-binding protein [Endomicrobium sp.]|jgi:acyl-[acyl-carrier-protein]-phospholipid O-acyltransferase/long-chain-fatty-acid--[acyl-carrier-protein] ligase|nr:AMP-binding protein [Endomicrobium sp.]
MNRSKEKKSMLAALIFPKTMAIIAAIIILSALISIFEFVHPAFGWSITWVLLTILLAFAVICVKKPVLIIHFLIWITTHTIYKIKVVGHENIPESGGALLVSNSVSYIDHVLIFAAVKRPVKFFVGREFKEHPLLRPFLDHTNSIPIDPADGPKVIGAALKEARLAIRAGGIVCIFAEGDLTRTGNMLPFKRGFEFIARDLAAPIIPLHLDRIWGSTFSFVEGKMRWRMPKVVPYPVTVSIGGQMPSSSQAFQVRLGVQELSAQAFKLRGAGQKKLHIGFIYEMRRHPFRFAFGDLEKSLSFIKVFVAAAAMSRRIGKKNSSEEMIGILLPTTIASVIANIAAAFAGKIAVNLNFTSSKETLESCIKQCDIKQIITSKAFVDKIDLHCFDDKADFAEDINRQIKTAEKIFIFAAALFFPAKLLIKKYVKGDTSNIDDVATVVFSSGTTGEPKGIMLTHQNIASDIESAVALINLKSSDVLAGILPLFHSFGYTLTVWLCAYYGIGAALHTNPMDAQTIGELVEKYKCTLLVSTPTFLNSYTRKCSVKQFASLRLIIAGAEKLKHHVSRAFHEKFQKPIYEGYGATELSPIVSFGLPCYIDPKTKKMQVGNKFGTVGHPMPGIAAKIVNPETFELMPFGQEGMLLIKGPNVMKGYLNDPQKTAEVIKDGWYITGDIAIIDEDGFIAITDRLSRFSKIAGEMVPHIRVEEEMHEAVGVEERFAIVTSALDDKKGEKLIVLYKGDANILNIIDKLKEREFPNLWIPKRENFYRVEDFPVLSNGKTDFKKIRQIASEFAAAR